MSVAAFLRDSRVGGLHKNGQVPKDGYDEQNGGEHKGGRPPGASARTERTRISQNGTTGSDSQLVGYAA
jgi:hypothetical protein